MELEQDHPRKKTCANTLFMFEDKIIKDPGLYFLWCTIFFINMIVLCIDNTSGPSRDFNVISSIISTIYLPMTSINNVYGTGKPSFGLITAGPVHQYSTWLLLAYYQGAVYGSNPLGIMNCVYTIIVGLFSIDMFTKTWYSVLYTSDFVAYIKDNK